MTLAYVVLATFTGGVLSLLGSMLLITGFPQRWLPRLVGFAAGVLLAVALLEVLPEAFESGVEPHRLFMTLLVGLLAFYGLERAALWRHAHADEHGHDHYCPTDSHSHGMSDRLGKPTVLSVMLGDGFHNFVDGVLVAASFLVNPALGWSTAFAIVAHEIPQEAGDFVIMRTAGLSKLRALSLNAASCVMSIFGGIVGCLALSHMQGVLPYILCVSAASFLYISISDLLPMLRRESHRHTSMWQTVAMVLGVIAVAVGVGLHGHH